MRIFLTRCDICNKEINVKQHGDIPDGWYHLEIYHKITKDKTNSVLHYKIDICPDHVTIMENLIK